MENTQRLIKRIVSKEASIAIIGLGYVGLPLALRFADCGYTVNGIDTNEDKIALLKKGKSTIKSIEDSYLQDGLEENFSISSDFSIIGNSDAIIICVPTPLGIHKEPDLSHVKNVLLEIKPYLKHSQILSLESTTYPGTTSEIILPIFDELNLNVGIDFYIVHSPEREDPGNKTFDLKSIPKIVGGHTAECLKVGKHLYQQVVESVIEVSSTEAAEMTKLLENIYRSVNIGLVNELKIVASAMNIDIYEVIDAAATKPFGYTPFYPGPGLGGHCIPIDPFYLSWKAKEFGVNTKFIELAGEVNSNMPNWVSDQIGLALNSASKSVSNSKILILGVAYKKNIDDLRESPALVIIENLYKLGADIDFCDPYIENIACNYIESGQLSSLDFNQISFDAYDLVVLLTDHDDFDYDEIEKKSHMILDTRGVYRHSKNKVFRA